MAETLELTARQAELIQVIQNITKEIGGVPTLAMLDANPDWPGKGAIYWHFKNYTELLELANLKARVCTKRYCTKEMMKNLQEFALELGRAPMKSEVRANPELPSEEIYLGLYSDWESVLAAIGISSSWCSNWLREKLLSDLWQMYVGAGYEPPKPQNIHTYLRIFGDLRYAWEAAGIWEDYCRRVGEKITATILKLYDELGRVPKLRDPGMPDEYLIKKVYGGYTQALAAAGLKANHQQYTREQLIRQLQRKYRELGRVPKQRDIDADPEMAGVNTFRSAFGSFMKALKAAKLPVGTAGYGHRYTKAELKKQLRRKYRELGRAPMSREIDADPRMASGETFRRVFGGIKEALAEAGLNVSPSL